MATGFTVATNEHLIRSNVWSRQIKELLLDDLMGTKYVKILTDFPDGTTLNIPSIGEAETADFDEGLSIKYNKMDTGNFTFTFDQYKYSANAISKKFEQDSYYASDVIAAFVPRQHRALMESVETRIFAVGNSGQTASNANLINNAAHRFVAGGTSEVMAVSDFAKAYFALQVANVPMTNLTAIVDPTVAFALQTATNITNYLSPMQMWENVVQNNLVTGMKFRFNLYGFDVYVSNYLPKNVNETIGSKTTAAGVANFFFSSAPGDTLPWVGGFRQMPTVYSEFNKDLQQEEYVTIARWGFKLYRPENLVIVLSDTDQIPA